jgi:tetratricopeptide (TPR) repeat protein
VPDYGLRIAVFALVLVALLCGGCSKSARKARYLADADRDFAAGQYEKAEIEYLKVLQIFPLDPTAISHLGMIYYEQGRLRQAFIYLKKATELLPDNPDLRLKLCLTELALGFLNDAREDALRVLQKQPGQPDALVALAQSVVSLTNAQETIKQIEKMRQADKDRPGYHLGLVLLYTRIGQLSNVAPELNQALALDPKLPATQLILGSFFWLSNDLARAESTFKAAAESSPPRSPIRVSYAEFKLRTGSVDEAKKILEDITREAPDYLPAWNFLAQIAWTQQKLADCNALVQKVLAKDPENYQATRLDVDLKLGRKEVQPAIEELLRLSNVYRTPEVQMQLARCYELSGDQSKAEACLRKALEFNPNFSEAIIALAGLNINKDPVAAARSLEQLLRRPPQPFPVYFLLASAYAAQKNPDQVLSVYRRMQTEFPTDPQPLYLIAKLQAAYKQWADARANCEGSLKLKPDFLPALELLVTVDLADKKSENALKRIENEIQLRPAVPELQVLLGVIYLNQTNYSKAEAAFLKAIEMAPGLRAAYLVLAETYVAADKPQAALDKLNSFVARTNDTLVLMKIGTIQESLKNYPAARATYEKLLTVDPKFAAALNNLAYLYSEQFNEIDKALKLAEQAQQMYPTDPSIADTFAWLLCRKGDYARALPLLTKAAAAAPAPEHAEMQYHLGVACYALGQETAARQALERSLKGDKDPRWKEQAQQRLDILAVQPATADPAAQTLLEKRLTDDPNDSIAMVRLAAIYERNGSADKAATTYQKALAQNPRNAPVLLSLARLYAAPGKMNNSQKALDYARDAYNAAPDDAAAARLFGHLVFQTGDYKSAANVLQDAALKSPNQPAVLYDLARAYYGLGQLSSAETAMRNALRTGTQFPQKEEAERFLSLLAAYRDPSQRKAVTPQIDASLKADTNYIPALMVDQVLQQEKGNYQDAKKTLERVLALNPQFIPAARDLAILCFERYPDDPRIQDLAAKARASFPDDPELIRILGVLAYRQADYPSAARYLKQGLQARSNDPDMLFYLGMTQYRLKAPAESKQLLKRALELNLAAKQADEAKRVLAELK